MLERGAAPQKRQEHRPQAVGDCQRAARPEVLQEVPQKPEEWGRPPGELRYDLHGALHGGRGRVPEQLHG